MTKLTWVEYAPGVWEGVIIDPADKCVNIRWCIIIQRQTNWFWNKKTYEYVAATTLRSAYIKRKGSHAFGGVYDSLELAKEKSEALLIQIVNVITQ